MTLVLVVDDIAAMAEQYAYDLQRVGGYQTLVANGGREALDLVMSEAVDCVILDLEMPGVDGFEVLRTLQERGVETPVIVYTGTGNYDRCIQAIRLGAYSFIDKAESMERVVREVENALERMRLVAEVRSLKRGQEPETPLVGSSPAMRALKESIARLAPIPSPVLVVGESGSGKELVARELHRLGKRPNGPFIALNSAALPENLVESELFGHERGAFTGASRTRKGAFENASGGTLFLDEVGELPGPAQAKLLRCLEEDQVTRVGGERAIKVDTRVVAATNRDLEAEVVAGRFRQDLLYRLNVHVVAVPPLRDRLSDVPELTEHFVASTCARFGVRRKQIDGEALEALMAGEWRAN
ncbi:MAG: sigma-54 dependent transcriptional regulator, partial [Gemmatimonadales bacterium]